MTSIVEICSAALVKIGAAAIQSLDDNLKEAQVAKTLYPFVRDSELSNYPWQFAGTKVELSRTTEVPIDKTWKYAYQLPNDCLSVRSGFDASGKTATYYVEDNTLYSLLDRAFIVYTQKKDEAFFPAYFVDVLIVRLTYEFGIAVLGLQTDEERFMKEYGAKHRKAKRVDSNFNQPESLIAPANSSLIRARFGYR